MTEVHLVAKKLALIETHLRELREAGRPELITSDLRELRFTEHTLQIAVPAALDAASHIVSEERLGERTTNRELFDLLARHHCIDDDLAGGFGGWLGSGTSSCMGTPRSIRWSSRMWSSGISGIWKGLWRRFARG